MKKGMIPVQQWITRLVVHEMKKVCKPKVVEWSTWMERDLSHPKITKSKTTPITEIFNL